MRSGAPARSEAAPALVVTLAGAAMTLAALTFAASSLYVPGIGFVLLGLSARAWVGLAARDAGVRRRLRVRRVLEGETFEAVIEVRRGRLGLPNGTVHDMLAGTPIPVAEHLSMIWGAPKVELRVVTRLERRGRHELPPPSLSLSDPLGLARAGRPGQGDSDVVLVLPRTEPVRWVGSERGRAAALPLSRSAREPTGAGEIDGLRGYMPGTPASRIHWPALARGAGLLERRLVGEPEGRPLVVIDPRAGEAPGAQDRLDHAIRAAASLTLELARGGGCTVLLPGARVPLAVGRELAAWPAIHARLAMVELEPDPSRAPVPAAEALRGPVVWVAAATAPNQHPLARSHSGALVLVIPSTHGSSLAARASFQVAGCTGFLLDSAGARPRRRRAA